MEEEIKKSRSSTKRKLTNLIRKLSTSLQYGADQGKIEKEANLLEEGFDELCSLHMEYEEVTDSEDSEYLNEITNSYNNVMKSYYNSIKEDKKIECLKQSLPLTESVDRLVKRITLNLERLETTSTTDYDIHALEVDKESLERDMQTIVKYVNELSSLVDASEKQNLIDVLSTRADKIMRTVEIMIRKDRSLRASEEGVKEQVSSFASSNISSLSSPLPTSKVSSELETASKEITVPTEVSTSLYMTSTTSCYGSPSLSSNLFAASTSRDMNQINGALSKTSIATESPVINQSKPGSFHSSYPSSSLHYSMPRMSAPMSMSTGHTIHTLPQSSSTGTILNNETSINPLAAVHRPEPIQSLALSQYLLPSSVMPSSIPTGHNILDSPHPSNTNVNAMKQEHLSSSTGDLHPAGSIQPPPQSHQLPYLSPQATPSPSHTNQHQVRKVDLPDFDGDRKHWPEFKAIFRHLAESTYTSQQALAYELKRHVKAPADALIQSIYCTKEGAYQKMWQRLADVYDDPGASISAALSTLNGLQKPGEEFQSIVSFINQVESVHAQLEQQNQVSCVSVRDVDYINSLLPMNLKMEWNRIYTKLPIEEKIQPFSTYMNYLERERAAIIRVAGPNTENKRPRRTTVTYGQREGNRSCLFHNSAGHKTKECRNFARLTIKERYDLLRKEKACFKCFEHHQRGECFEEDCSTCGKPHNTSLCTRSPPVYNKEGKDDSEHVNVSVKNNSCISSPAAILPISQTDIPGRKIQAQTLFDSGSDSSYVTFKFADKLGLKPVCKITLDVTTMGNNVTSVPTSIFEVPLRCSEGEVVTIEAFGIKEITGEVKKLNEKVVRELFPKYDCSKLQRTKPEVDILIGCDNFGLHPKKEVTKSGDNLSIMSGKLGVCLQGAHERLEESTRMSANYVKVLHGCKPTSHTFLLMRHQHHLFAQSCISQDSPTIDSRVERQANTTSVTLSMADNFINGENLGTAVNPTCGSCKCGKCPLLGHSYSFIEQQELDMIRSGLKYDHEKEHWVTSYPWLMDPSHLPDNFTAAKYRLQKLENSLNRDPKWQKSYKDQIQDMIDREVARKLTQEEIDTWKGPKFYISHLAVVSPKSASTPIRIVFNSSQVHKGTSLNNCLAKGPDSYANNILGLLIRWREERVAMVGDIRKMFHSIHLQELESHCHRFLWRDMDDSKDPEVYIITRVNMGDRPASAIATEALRATAVMSEKIMPEASNLIINSSYVDDLIDSKPSMEKATSLAHETNSVLQKGGFQIKCWQFSMKDSATNASGTDSTVSLLKGSTDTETAVLGVNWNPLKDAIVFHVCLNFSEKKRGVRSEADLTQADIPHAIPNLLTRRIVLQQVMTIYDPLGIICPFTLKAKILLRNTWELKLDWDEPLPAQMRAQWVTFFEGLFQLEQLILERALTPKNAVGQPWLILFSDGSEIAYGFAAYIRWKLQDGSYWCRLIMAKSRIAPLHRITIPRMELNAAVLSKRGRQIIESESRIVFEKTLHLIDSQTILSMLHKTSTRFQVYEGSRVGEIQSANGGDMSEWGWISGENNVADHLTRGLEPADLDQNSTWWNGPAFLYREFETWEVKQGSLHNENLPGEKVCLHLQVTPERNSILDLSRYSSLTKATRIVARILGIFQKRSFKGGSLNGLTPALMTQAELFLIKEAQLSLEDKIQNFKKLNPVKNKNDIWVVGATRLANHNPLSAIHSSLPILLPCEHFFTKLAMKDAHEKGHRGRDGTVAMFRNRFWTPQGPRLAKKVRNDCQMCRLRERRAMRQEMGRLPIERLKPAPPFNYTMLDLFGPYTIRGEVQKRVSSKAWGVIFTDLVSRAVHIEIACGYDTSNFMLALRRFVSIRGWPQKIFSDPGSQLTCADKEIKDAFSKAGSEHGMEWVIGTPDSPWHQGAVESLIKTVKRALKFAIHEQRLSATELLTVCTEAANLINERPLGTLPELGSEINVLTPNCLLLGRATALNPNDWESEYPSVRSRQHLVASISNQFWVHWMELFAPSLVYQQKWHEKQRDIKKNDVVLVLDSNSLKGEYRLAIVTQTHPGRDGKVRTVTVSYKNMKAGEKIREYKGQKYTAIKRSVQRLVLLVPVEEQS